LEFLRGVEFQNFTNAAKAAKVVIGINKKIKKKFFKGDDRRRSLRGLGFICCRK
jgi:hypothetical protein